MGTTPPPTSFTAESMSAFVGMVREALPANSFWTMPVLAAVSGGGDSVALLVALRRIVPNDAVHRLVVAHAEHDLRGDAADDREFVGRLAARLGLRFVARRLAIRPNPGEGIEAAARRQRYDFLSEVAADAGARHVLVAHTADDQAETILLRMLRGTSVAGLAGMSRARELLPGVSLLRPLLEVRRAAARGFLQSLGEEWREDPTNDDVRHARNFLRHDVLVACADGPFPAATECLSRLGHQASQVAGALRSAAERLLDEHSRRRPDGRVLVQTAGLTGLDPFLVAEVFVALWRREGWPQRDMTARHYDAVAALALAGQASKGTLELPGLVSVQATMPGTLCASRRAT